MKTIYKYPLSFEDRFLIDMPDGAQPLSLQMQHGVPCLWAMVDTNAPTVKRALYCRGTGHDADAIGNAEHLGSVQMQGGALIFHFFLEEQL